MFCAPCVAFSVLLSAGLLMQEAEGWIRGPFFFVRPVLFPPGKPTQTSPFLTLWVDLRQLIHHVCTKSAQASRLDCTQLQPHHLAAFVHVHLTYCGWWTVHQVLHWAAQPALPKNCVICLCATRRWFAITVTATWGSCQVDFDANSPLRVCQPAALGRVDQDVRCHVPPPARRTSTTTSLFCLLLSIVTHSYAQCIASSEHPRVGAKVHRVQEARRYPDTPTLTTE